MVTTRARRPRRDRVDPALAEFVKTIGALDYVELIAMDEEGDEGVPIVSTIIDAPSWVGEYRTPIVKAEIQADSGSPRGFEFRMLNLRELSEPVEQSRFVDSTIPFERVPSTHG